MPNTYNLPAGATLAPRTARSTLKFVVTAAQEIDVYGDLEGSGAGDFMSNGSVAMTGAIDMGEWNSIISIGGLFMEANDRQLVRLATDGVSLLNGSGNKGIEVLATSTALGADTAERIIVIDINNVVLAKPMWMGSNPIKEVFDPVDAQDAATKAYVDANSGGGGGDFMASGSVPMTGDFVGGNNNIIDVNGVHLRSLFDINGVQRFNINDANFSLVFYKADGLATAFEYNGNADIFEFDIPVLLQGNVISAVADPVDPQDAATKAYVDDTIAALPPAGDFMADGSVPMTDTLYAGGIEASSISYNLSGYGFIIKNGYDVPRVIFSGQPSDNSLNITFYGTTTSTETFSYAGGAWTFGAPVNGATPTADTHLATKAYVDTGDLVLLSKVDALESALAKAMALITALQAQVDAL